MIMKKSICALLCVLILLGSVAIAGAENEPQTHVSGCECESCAGPKVSSDLTFTEPTFETTIAKAPLADLLSDAIGDQLHEAGKDFDQKLSVAQKITQMFHDFFMRLASFSERLSQALRDFLKR